MRTARAKGVPRRVIVWRHGLRNASLPVVTVVGLYVGILIGNSVLTEIVFNRPGLGKIIVGALNQRDYTMLQGLMVIYCFLIVVVNLLTDLDLRLHRSAGEARMSGIAPCPGSRPISTDHDRRRPVPAVLAGASARPGSPANPLDQNIIDRSRRPAGDYLFGTDNYGRDVLSRILWGGRISLMVVVHLGRLRHLWSAARSAWSAAMSAAAPTCSSCR